MDATKTTTEARRDDMKTGGPSNVGATCWMRTVHSDTHLQGVIVRDDRHDDTGKRLVIVRTGKGPNAEYHLKDELPYFSLIHDPR